jgi:hypothetical protein
MIEGIFGLPGNGKTYEAVRRLLVRADRGEQCYSVTPIDHPNVEQITYEDFVSAYMPPGTCLMDEVHLWLPSSGYRMLDPRVYARLSQTGKRGLDLIYTAQHESKVLKQLRDNTNFGWRSQAWGGMGQDRRFSDRRGHPLLFTSRCWPMETYRKGKPLAFSVHRFSMRVAKAYETTFEILEGPAIIEGRGAARLVSVDDEESA